MKNKTDDVKKKSSKPGKATSDLISTKPDDIEFNPTMEAVGKVAVFGFGRMNPPTQGHEKLVKKIQQIAQSKNATPLVFLSQSHDPKKNPLDYQTKIRYAQKAFGGIIQKAANVKTVIQLAQQLEKSYDSIIMVAGSDRVRDFKMLLDKYNGKDYNFSSIEVVSAGDRDPDADDVTGMSASKMRAAAADDDFQSFAKGVPTRLKSMAQQMFADVQHGMHIIEELEEQGLLIEAGLSMAQRLRRRMVFRKNKMRVQIGRRKAMRRRASQGTHVKRARRSAISTFKSRLAGGKKVKDLSPADKKRLETIISKRKSIIDRLSRRMVRTSREKERARFTREQYDINEQFSALFTPTIDITDVETTLAVLDEAYNIIMEESGNFKTFDAAKKQAIEAQKRDRDPSTHIEIWKNKDGSFDTVHEMNSSGRNSIKKHGGKLVAIVKRGGKVLHNTNFKEDVDEAFTSFLAEKTSCSLITAQQLKDLEKFADRLLEKLNIDIEFTKHFGERMSDGRNDPCIGISELQQVFKKIKKTKGDGIKSHPDMEVVIKDIQKDLNIPVVIDYKKQTNEFEVTLKTIMRKKNFSTPNAVVKV